MKKFKKKLGLSLDDNQEPPKMFEQSMYSKIDEKGVNFIEEGFHITYDGLIKGEKGIPVQLIKKDQLEFGKPLGAGVSGTVYAGVYKPTGTKVAIKTINIYDSAKRHQLKNDLKVFLGGIKQGDARLNQCPFLVHFVGAFFDENSVKIVLELMDYGSIETLSKKLKEQNKQGTIPEEILANISMQILNGLMYLHIIGHSLHRDIKPANILINSKGEVKLTDFGLAKELDMTYQMAQSQLGTIGYMSPERLNTQNYNHLSDIWSFGLILIELAQGQFPYPVNKTRNILDMIDMTGENPAPTLDPNSGYSFELKDFIDKCLKKNPKERASAVELLSHPWILKNLFKNVELDKWLSDIYNEKTE